MQEIIKKNRKKGKISYNEIALWTSSYHLVQSTAFLLRIPSINGTEWIEG